MGWRSSILIVALVFGILFSVLYVSAQSAPQRQPNVIPIEPRISQLKAIEITEQNLQKQILNLDGAWLDFYQYNFSLTRFQAGFDDPEYENFIRSVNRNGGWTFPHVKEHPELLQLPLYFVHANGTQYEITNSTYKMRCIKAPDISRCPLFLPAAEAAKGKLVYRIESRWHPASTVLPIGGGYHIIDAETGKLVWNSIDWEKSRNLIPKVQFYNNTNPPKTIKQIDEEKQQLIQKALNPPQALKIKIAEGASNKGQPTNFVPKDARCPIGICNKVEWTNNDTVVHTIRSDNNYTNPYAGKFSSDLIKPNEMYEYTFVELGEYRYHCDIHPWMRGIVAIVENFA